MIPGIDSDNRSENFASVRDLAYPIRYIKGIGPRRALVLEKQGILTVRDLLYYFPFGYTDLSKTEKIRDLHRISGSCALVTVIGKVRTFDLVGRPPRQRFVVVLDDDSGTVELIFFRGMKYFRDAFENGEIIAASGKVTSFNNRLQMVHASVDHLSKMEEGDYHGFLHTSGIVPKYGSSGEMKGVNLNVKGFRRIARNTLDEFLDCVEEILPASMIERNGLMPLRQALSSIHFPESMENLESARRRLKFDELFTLQYILALNRKIVKSEGAGIVYDVQSSLARRLVDSLPFKLTKGQLRVINEIAGDMKSNKPMHRLLQGDVGSGKTIVALIAALIAVDNGYQSAFMAPTEVLAEQHYRTISGFLNSLNVKVSYLAGGQKARMRDAALEEIRSGSAGIVVGTHALIQKSVAFAGLGFVVIDEQHRFGVAQRVALREKGGNGKGEGLRPDVLVMTATPIPRTLSFTVYGDLDISTIDELPACRKPVMTAVRLQSQMKSVYDFVRKRVREGSQIYFVYPIIEESEKVDLKAAVENYEKLKSDVFPELRIGLMHGRLAPEEKEEIMSDFKAGRLDLLVATTVIEVGIDVPNASVMVIEHAERFGLAQLHQLRGRVGRGAIQSYCILVAPDWFGRSINRDLSSPSAAERDEEMFRAVRRLQTMLTVNDGFKIAEIDLELRGPGDFLGTRQSGIPAFRIADIVTDGDLLSLAREEAFRLTDDDPHLRKTGHRSLKKYFDERLKESIALLKGG